MLRSLLTILTISLLPPALLASEPPESPDWTLATPDGEAVNLDATVRSQTTILLFWATWCPYCKALMPHLQSIRLEMGDDVRVLAISILDDGDPAAFINEAGYDFTVLPDGDRVAALYDVTGTPGVFVVDSQRRIQFDLRQVPRPQMPGNARSGSNSVKAAYLAPYWAAELRKSLDAVHRDR